MSKVGSDEEIALCFWPYISDDSSLYLCTGILYTGFHGIQVYMVIWIFTSQMKELRAEQAE